jgi:hypothetical protein
MLAFVLFALLQSPVADYPKQLPIRTQDLSTCRVPEYAGAEYEAMTKVVEVTEVRQKFPGSYMFVPAGGGVHPGVLFLHGSGGGRNTPNMACTARVIAANGYAALSFCYFDCGVDAIPEALADVDLRRTYDAMVWLKQSRYVGGGKIALFGASRGAEKAALLASLLAHAAIKDNTIVVPDVLYSSAVYGRVVGAFNWRTNPDDPRWQQYRHAYAACLRPDPDGPYSVNDEKGNAIAMRWNDALPACARRPALGTPDCWRPDPKGRYSGPRGVLRTWLTHLCAAPPSWDTIFDAAAWRWDLDPARARAGNDIELHYFKGPILIAHGAIDPLWSVEQGPDYLRRTLDRNGIRSHRQVIPKITAPLPAWPKLPDDRVQIYIFDDEPHAFSVLATKARRQLYLAFLDRTLR